MKTLTLTLALTLLFPALTLAQQGTSTPTSAPLPSAPSPAPTPNSTSTPPPLPSPMYGPTAQNLNANAAQIGPIIGATGTPTPITLAEAERLALRNNPRITAAHLLALASGQVTREVRANELPQINAYAAGVAAEDGSRIGASDMTLTSSRLYNHAGVGGDFSDLLTDFGHTHNLVLNAQLQAKAQQQNAAATEQDVLLATDQAFFRLLDAQSLLDVAVDAVNARGSVENLTGAKTKSGLASNLDLNVAAADLSQAQMLELDAENDVATASARLAALLAAPPTTFYKAVEDPNIALPLPPDNAAPIIADAETERPDLRALKFTTAAAHKLVLAQREQNLPSISALATGGVTPASPGGTVFAENWWAAGGVNLALPVFTGFRISAQTEEAKLRERAAAEQQRNLSNNIARDVQVAVLAAQTAFRRVNVAEQFRAEAGEAFALARTRYKLGLTSIVELSQAQLQATQANVSAVNARYDYLMALRNLAYARGTLAP